MLSPGPVKIFSNAMLRNETKYAQNYASLFNRRRSSWMHNTQSYLIHAYSLLSIFTHFAQIQIYFAHFFSILVVMLANWGALLGLVRILSFTNCSF